MSNQAYMGDEGFVYAEITGKGLTVYNHHGAEMGKITSEDNGRYIHIQLMNDWEFSPAQLEEIAKIGRSFEKEF